MKALLLALVCLSGCAEVPLHVQIERRGTGLLYRCLHSPTGPFHREQCLEQSQAWCQEHGQQKNCAVDGLW